MKCISYFVSCILVHISTETALEKLNGITPDLLNNEVSDNIENTKIGSDTSNCSIGRFGSLRALVIGV